MLAEPEDLRRVQLQHVLHDVVVGDFIAPALRAGVVEGVRAELGSKLGRRPAVVGWTGGVEWLLGGVGVFLGLEVVGADEPVPFAGVVEMDVERQWLVVFRVSLVELALDGTVAGADVVLDDVLNDRTDVLDLGQFNGRPVVQKLSALHDDLTQVARVAIEQAVVESLVV